jgi:hypothetical protein
MKPQHVTGNPENGPQPVYRGEFEDSHWHVRYKVPTDGSTASIYVDNLWAGGGVYTLYGPAVAP